MNKSEIVLESYKFGLALALSDSMLSTVHVETRVRELAMRDGLHLISTFRLYGVDGPKYQWPEDWRQAVKERWYPRWAKARWPIQYHTLDVKELHPSIALPEEAPVYYIAENRCAE